MPSGAKLEGDQLRRFGPFELNLTRRAVFRNGIRLKLQQQPFSVLELLIEQAPEIVPREDIRRRIWGDDVHVDADQGIAFCIRQIRSVLCDDSTSPRYIETIPRQGFRFVGNLETRYPETPPDEGSIRSISESVTPEELGLPSAVKAPDVSASSQSKRRKIHPWVVVSSIAAALVGVIGVISFHLTRHDELYTVAQVKRATTYPGAALHPSFSPDGRQVAFSWDGEGPRSIYIAVPQSEQRMRLTTSASSDDFPKWSPDGNYIAFVRFSSPYAGELMLVPALGGAERALHAVDLSFETFSSSSLIAWTPDSKWICFATRSDKSKSHAWLVLFSPDTAESRAIISTTDQRTSDSSPAFSPDGRWLAFARFATPFNSTILLQHLSPGLQPDGKPSAVRGAGTNPLSPVWTQDSRSVLFLDRGPSRLLQAGISDVEFSQPAHQIYVSNTSLDGLSFAGPEPRLCSSSSASGTDLWALSLKGHSGAARNPRKILDTKANQYHPEYSPDGSRLAFASDLDGLGQVWVASADGDSPRQLTHLPNHILGWPRWSPDGQWIVFHARVPDNAELYVTRVADGLLRQVTHGFPGIVVPSWSADGKFLYGFGLHSGAESIFRIPVASGNREVLWEGTIAREVPGRHLLLYSKIHQNGIFARRLTERGPAEPEQKLVDDFNDVGTGGFAPFTDGFYYSASGAGGSFRAICFYSFESRKTVDVAPAPPNLANGFTVSPDRSTLMYAGARSYEANLVSLELKKEANTITWR